MFSHLQSYFPSAPYSWHLFRISSLISPDLVFDLVPNLSAMFCIFVIYLPSGFQSHRLFPWFLFPILSFVFQPFLHIARINCHIFESRQYVLSFSLLSFPSFFSLSLSPFIDHSLSLLSFLLLLLISTILFALLTLPPSLTHIFYLIGSIHTSDSFPTSLRHLCHLISNLFSSHFR